MSRRLPRKKLKKKLGVANVLTTLILVSVTITVTLAGTFFAYQLVEFQTELAEFENGKTAMVNFAEMVEGLTFAKGSAAYTRFFIRTGGLSLTNGTDSVNIAVDGTTVHGPSTVNQIKLRGGSMVDSPDYQVLRGLSGINATRYLIINDSTPSPPLGWVYLKRQNGAWVIVDFCRVRVVFSGTNNVTIDGLNWEALNYVELTYIKPHFGTKFGRDTFDVRARVTNVQTSVKRFANSAVTITVTRGSLSQSYKVPSPSTFNGKPVSATIVIISVIEVEVSVS